MNWSKTGGTLHSAPITCGKLKLNAQKPVSIDQIKPFLSADVIVMHDVVWVYDEGFVSLVLMRPVLVSFRLLQHKHILDGLLSVVSIRWTDKNNRSTLFFATTSASNMKDLFAGFFYSIFCNAVNACCF